MYFCLGLGSGGGDGSLLCIQNNIISVYERLGDNTLEEHKHWCRATKQDICSRVEFKPEPCHTNGNSQVSLIVICDLHCLWGNLSSVAIFTYIKKSAPLSALICNSMFPLVMGNLGHQRLQYI